MLYFSSHSQWKILISWLEEKKWKVVDIPHNKSNNETNSGGVEPHTVRGKDFYHTLTLWHTLPVISDLTRKQKEIIERRKRRK